MMNTESIRRSVAVGYWKTVERLANWVARPESSQPRRIPTHPRGILAIPHSHARRRWLKLGGLGTVGIGIVGAAIYLQEEHMRGRVGEPPVPREPGRPAPIPYQEFLSHGRSTMHRNIILTNEVPQLSLIFTAQNLEDWYYIRQFNLGDAPGVRRRIHFTVSEERSVNLNPSEQIHAISVLPILRTVLSAFSGYPPRNESEGRRLIALFEDELTRRLLVHLRFSIEELNDPAQLPRINTFGGQQMVLLSSLGASAPYPLKVDQLDHVMLMKYLD